MNAKRTTTLTVAVLMLSGFGLATSASALHLDYSSQSTTETYEAGNGLIDICESGSDNTPGAGGLCFYSVPSNGTSGANNTAGCASSFADTVGCDTPEDHVWHTVQFVGQNTGNAETGFARLGTNSNGIDANTANGTHIYYRALTAFWADNGHLTWFANDAATSNNDPMGGQASGATADQPVPASSTGDIPATCNDRENAGNAEPDAENPPEEHTICVAFS